MRIFRRNRISERQVRDILQSLPQVQAAAGFEDRLGSVIEAQKLEVPHILGSLPRVPAADDFDARLMQAIQDRRRPVPPIMTPVAETALRTNWFSGVGGWVGGALVMVTLAFVVDRSGVMDQQSAVSPAPAVRSLPAAAAPMSVPAPPSQATSARETPASASSSAAIASTASTISVESPAPAPVHQHQAPAASFDAPSVRNMIPAHEVEMNTRSMNREEIRKVNEPVLNSNQTGHTAEPSAAAPQQDTPASTVATPSAEQGTEVTISAEKDGTLDSVMDGGIVNTGGERGSDNGNTP